MGKSLELQEIEWGMVVTALESQAAEMADGDDRFQRWISQQVVELALKIRKDLNLRTPTGDDF